MDISFKESFDDPTMIIIVVANSGMVIIPYTIGTVNLIRIVDWDIIVTPLI